MKQKRRIFKLSVIILSVVMLLVITGSFRHASTTPSRQIRIGSIMPVTGPLAILGLAFNRGWQLYIDKINGQGGLKVGGETYLFELISEDSKLSPEAAGTAAKKLISQDKVNYLIGGILEAELEAIQQIALAHKVPFIEANINFPGHRADVSPKKPLVARLCISHDDTHVMDLDYLVKTYPKARKLVLVAGDNGYENMIKDITAQAKQRGVQVVGVELWALGVIDFIPTYTKALSHNPDVIWSIVTGQATYQLMAARQLGFKGPFISNSPLGPEVFQMVVKDPDALTDVITNGVDLSRPTEPMKDAMARWQSKFKDPFVSDSLHAWDQIWILTQAMEKAKSVEGGKVFTALQTMTAPGSLKTCYGPGQMGGAKKFGINLVLVKPIPMTRLMNGKTEFIGFKMAK